MSLVIESLAIKSLVIESLVLLFKKIVSMTENLMTYCLNDYHEYNPPFTEITSPVI